MRRPHLLQNALSLGQLTPMDLTSLLRSAFLLRLCQNRSGMLRNISTRIRTCLVPHRGQLYGCVMAREPYCGRPRRRHTCRLQKRCNRPEMCMLARPRHDHSLERNVHLFAPSSRKASACIFLGLHTDSHIGTHAPCRSYHPQRLSAEAMKAHGDRALGH